MCSIRCRSWLKTRICRSSCCRGSPSLGGFHLVIDPHPRPLPARGRGGNSWPRNVLPSPPLGERVVAQQPGEVGWPYVQKRGVPVTFAAMRRMLNKSSGMHSGKRPPVCAYDASIPLAPMSLILRSLRKSLPLKSMVASTPCPKTQMPRGQDCLKPKAIEWSDSGTTMC
jgi:hypothetical protein